jgi:4-amino-4-deoxy-L-arabinose transferase-like glycosyltransferase
VERAVNDRETQVVVILTLAGAVLRIWSLGHLGFTHFDEGIYALAGLWSVSPRGLQGFDPSCIAYAPPGYPILVGLSYLFLGVSDTPAILVSIVCGTATVPVVAWLSRRTFGGGAGAVAAAFAAFSGAHTAFSRMALTDAAFLLALLLAFGQGQRFLEEPRATRALWLGLSVGIAQLFKYNGWMAGAFVAVAALLGLLAWRNAEGRRTSGAIWGWGVLAMLVAAVAYLPWFQFVESHGGYRALLAHHRAYMNGVSRWVGNWSVQLDMARVLAGDTLWRGGAGIAAALGMSITFGQVKWRPLQWPQLMTQTVGLASIALFPNFGWWASLAWIALLATTRALEKSAAALLLAVGWLSLSILTPFYRPYARLWLPLDAFAWIVLGGVFVPVGRGLGAVLAVGLFAKRAWLKSLLGWTLVWVWALGILAASLPWLDAKPHPGLLRPSDSLRVACRAIRGSLPSSINELRLYARPAAVFYLSLENRIKLYRQPSVDQVLAPSSRAAWSLLDTALLQPQGLSAQEAAKLSERWAVVCDVGSDLSLPTLLDIDPGASRLGRFNFSAPLRLLRPK